ncbi:MAG: hypothetical protein HZB44_10120 [Actinobacteria bacterium]|nr:hypothetical protein [Actinomycetota bacterium]
MPAGCGDDQQASSTVQGALNIDLQLPAEALISAINDAESRINTDARADFREELGPGADEIFAQTDKVRNTMLLQAQARLQQQEQNTAGSNISQTRLPSGNVLASSIHPKHKQEGDVIAGVFIAALMYIMNASSMGEGDGTIPIDQQYSDGNTTGHMTGAYSKSGSRMTAELEASFTTTSKDGQVYTEKAKCRIEMEICPDEQGEVPMTFSLSMSKEMKGPGNNGAFQWESSGKATGHVNDEAAISGLDYDVTTKQSHQGALYGAGETGNMFGEFRADVKISGFDTDNVVTTGTSEPTRSSSGVSDSFMKTAQESGKLLPMMFMVVLNKAQESWSNGYCVEIVVEGVEDSNEVELSETKQFKGKVRHKFEGGFLTVMGMKAGLSGEKDLKPTEKQETPVSYTYVAPDEEDKKATVNLETRSKRGAARKAITFRTKKDKPYIASGGSKMVMSGTICDLEAGFKLSAVGQNGIAYAFTFTPSNAKAGSMSYSGSGSGCTESGTGTYTVNLSDDEKSGTITENISGNITCSQVNENFSDSESFDINEAPPETCTSS